MGTTTTANDLWRLADEAARRGIRILEEPVSGEHFATSATNPRIVHRVTGFSCSCRGFLAWGRCTHHSLLLLELGWLPEPEGGDGPGEEPDPDPTPAAPAAPIPAEGRAAPWEEAPTIQHPPVPANVVAFPSAEGRAAAMAAGVADSLERLARQLAEGHTEEFRRLLAFMGRFHRYSPNNCLLILAQKPDATLVAGLRRWNDLGYKVKPGEKALWVWCPITRKGQDPATGEEEDEVVGFRPGPVFDASQLADLDAKPLPSGNPRLPDDAGEAYRAVKARVEAAGIFVQERPLPTGVEGLSKGGVIVVKEKLRSREKLFVLLHELAHEVAHHGEDRGQTTRQRRELEAEATAFVAAAALGFEVPGSRDYLLNYKVTAEELRAALASVRAIARRVLEIVVAEGTRTGEALAA